MTLRQPRRGRRWARGRLIRAKQVLESAGTDELTALSLANQIITLKLASQRKLTKLFGRERTDIAGVCLNVPCDHRKSLSPRLGSKTFKRYRRVAGEMQ